MTINIEETGADILPEELDVLTTAEDLLHAVSEMTDSEYELSCDILLCDENEIQELNHRFRGIDAPTDVLSFPNLEFDQAGVWPDHLEDDLFDPDSGELMFGSIVLCKQRVLEQAAQYGHSVRREYAFLITHSLLHLCGYDHMHDDERQMMEKTQENILKSLHLTREEA